ncbi:hypothetical protein D3C71_1756680 [compost metagenome]
MNVGVDGAREHLAFNVTPQTDVVLSALRVRNPNNVLLDDRSLVQIRRNVV